MLKRIIRIHTAARLDFCLYYRAYMYETLSFTNRERRVIASEVNLNKQIHINKQRKITLQYLQQSNFNFARTCYKLIATP